MTSDEKLQGLTDLIVQIKLDIGVLSSEIKAANTEISNLKSENQQLKNDIESLENRHSALQQDYRDHLLLD